MTSTSTSPSMALTWSSNRPLVSLSLYSPAGQAPQACPASIHCWLLLIPLRSHSPPSNATAAPILSFSPPLKGRGRGGVCNHLTLKNILTPPPTPPLQGRGEPLPLPFSSFATYNLPLPSLLLHPVPFVSARPKRPLHPTSAVSAPPKRFLHPASAASARPKRSMRPASAVSARPKRLLSCYCSPMYFMKISPFPDSYPPLPPPL